MTDFAQRLTDLRDELSRRKLDGFIVPRSDEFLGEYVPAYAERLQWLTGFSGSAGFAVVLADKAVVMSDSRYSIQLKQQVDQDLYVLEDYTQMPVEDWLAEHAKGQVIGYDPKIHSSTFIKKIEEKEVTLSPVKDNPIDAVWLERPAPPQTPIEIFDNKIAGRTPGEKISLAVQAMKKVGAQDAILTMGDSIAWLLNIRAHDIPHIPVALSYAIIHDDESVDWFIDPERVGDDVQTHLGGRVSLQPPATLAAQLENLEGRSVLVDAKRTPIWFAQKLKNSGATVIDAKDPCIDIRAQKTPSEIAAMRAAHVRDGKAVTDFLNWLKDQPNDGSLTELSVEEKLRAFRAADPDYIEDSFETIAGFNSNAAIVHYRASEKTSKEIKGDGLLLIDSGAQYKDGTTDITRTIAIGEPAQIMKEHYTLVLKAHIAVASARFPEGTTGKEIDALARAPLQAEGLNYGHGTGHGVGVYLSVHEEAANLSPRGEEALKPGMIISNEPGYYKEDHYGIRLENLVLVVETGDDGHLGFETLTQVPFDNSLILKEKLLPAELEWLENYHQGFSQ